MAACRLYPTHRGLAGGVGSAPKTRKRGREGGSQKKKKRPPANQTASHPRARKGQVVPRPQKNTGAATREKSCVAEALQTRAAHTCPPPPLVPTHTLKVAGATDLSAFLLLGWWGSKKRSTITPNKSDAAISASPFFSLAFLCLAKCPPRPPQLNSPHTLHVCPCCKRPRPRRLGTTRCYWRAIWRCRRCPRRRRGLPRAWCRRRGWRGGWWRCCCRCRPCPLPRCRGGGGGDEAH